MGHKRRNAERLIALWLASDAKCYWCGKSTVLLVTPPKSPEMVRRYGDHFPERASLDHLDTKLSGLRKQRSDMEPRTVLACYECNQRRNDEEVAALSKEELHRRSGRHPQPKRNSQMSEEQVQYLKSMIKSKVVAWIWTGVGWFKIIRIDDHPNEAPAVLSSIGSDYCDLYNVSYEDVMITSGDLANWPA